MEGLFLTLLAVLSLIVALLTVFGVLGTDSSIWFKGPLAGVTGLLGLSLLLWRLIVVSFSRWGLRLGVYGAGMERTLFVLPDGRQYAVAVLWTLWPHVPVNGLRIRLQTSDQSPMDTVLMSEDGKHEYVRSDETCYLTQWEQIALVPLAYKHGADNRAYLGTQMRDGKAIRRQYVL